MPAILSAQPDLGQITAPRTLAEALAACRRRDLVPAPLRHEPIIMRNQLIRAARQPEIAVPKAPP